MFSRILTRSGTGFLNAIRLSSSRADLPSGFRPQPVDKWILVHFKVYPDQASIPKYVNQSVMNKVKSKARIKMSLVIMGTVIIGCIGTSYWAKKHKHEHSVIEQSQRRHEQWKKGESGDVGRWSLMTGAGEKKE